MTHCVVQYIFWEFLSFTSSLTGGIGSEICKLLLSQGCEVIGVDCNSFRLQELATDFKIYSPPASFHSIVMDLSSDSSVIQGVKHIQQILQENNEQQNVENDDTSMTSFSFHAQNHHHDEKWNHSSHGQPQKKIFALINNAAVPSVSSRMSSTAEELPQRLQEMLNINVGGYHRMIHYLLPFFEFNNNEHVLNKQQERSHSNSVFNIVAKSLVELLNLKEWIPSERVVSEEKNCGAIIVNVSSGAGVLAGPFLGFYPITKFAIQGLTDVLRRELKHLGIRVCGVIPGFTKRGMIFSQNIQIDENSLLCESMKQMQQDMSSKLEWIGQEPSEVARVIFENCFSSNCGERVFADRWFMRIMWPLLLMVQVVCPSLVDRMF